MAAEIGATDTPGREHLDGQPSAPERTIADLDREVASLREELRRLTSQGEARPAAPAGEESRTGRWRERTSRRSLLGRAAALLAATGAAGVATASRAPRAEALDGVAIIAGQQNTTSGTQIWDQPAGAGHALWIVDQNNGALSYPTSTGALQGIASTDKDGVYGYAPGNAGYGVHARTDHGWAVMARSGTGIDIQCGGTGRLLLTLQPSAGAPTTGTHLKGEIVIDSLGNPYVCQSEGGVGVWSAVGNFKASFSPRRVYANTSAVAGTTYGPISVVGTGGVPAGAAAAYCAVQSYQAGVMTLFANGSADPGIANWSGTGTSGILNLLYMLVPLSSLGDFRIHTYFSGSIFVDVWGYVL